MKYKRRALSLSDSTNTTLLDQINRSPGIRYRELQRSSGIAHGRLEYHLKILEDLMQIKVSRYPTRKSTRYYPSGRPNDELRIIEYAQRTGAREIVQLLLEHEQCYFTDIVEYTRRVPSTVSYHLSRLRKGGIITSATNSRYKTFRLKNKDTMMRLMNDIGK